MNKRSGVETTIRKQSQDGRGHFQFAPALWSQRVFELLVPFLWGLTILVGLLAAIWINSPA